MSSVGAELRVSGMVQGVGYRYFCYRKANDLGITGWVKNQPVDWYGHPGESANICYTDGHVENHKTIDRKYWKID